MKLTKLERRLLINQYEILKKLEETDGYDDLITILREGYTALYGNVVSTLYDGLPEQDCRFVLDVLDMYRALEHYYEDNGDEELKKDLFARFAGFDGNNETHMMAFVQFLINGQGKFEEQKRRAAETDGFNSHMPCGDIYDRMLKAWEGQGRDYPLTGEVARKVVGAAKRQGAVRITPNSSSRQKENRTPP